MPADTPGLYPFHSGSIEAYVEIAYISSLDVSRTLHAIKRATKDHYIRELIQRFFNKWQGVPGDTDAALVELRKRSL